MALTILTFWWGDKYPSYYVDRLVAGVRNHLVAPHRFICVHGRGLYPPASVIAVPLVDPAFCTIAGCFARLRMFHPPWQRSIGVGPGDRVVWLDLDLIITGALDVLFDRPEPFVILQGANASNPCPYNGSVVMLRGGEHPEVFADFTLEAARAAPSHEFPDDQGWLAHVVPNAAGWKAGASSGIYAYGKPGWPIGRTDLPFDARIVAFPGSRDPRDFVELEWVRRHWCESRHHA